MTVDLTIKEWEEVVTGLCAVLGDHIGKEDNMALAESALAKVTDAITNLGSAAPPSSRRGGT